MLKEHIWQLFNKTGDLNAYLFIKELESVSNKSKENEETVENQSNLILR